MPVLFRTAALIVLVFYLTACKKEQVVKIEDLYVAPNDSLSSPTLEIAAVGHRSIELQWGRVTNTHFREVTYSLYLDNIKVAEHLTKTVFSLINLNSNQKYSVKLVASTDEGKKTEASIQVTTLPPSDGKRVLYREYSIHEYSTLMGASGVEKCSDGGHIIVRGLRHPGYFTRDGFKIVIFKTDEKGQIQWYRLLSAVKYNFDVYNSLSVCLHNESKQAIVFFGKYAIKLNTADGSLVAEKDLTSVLGGQSVQTIFSTSSGEILAAAGGKLICINPSNMAVVWNQDNTERPGTIGKINQDSKGNIYYSFRHKNESWGYSKLNVHFCNSQGDFLKELQFDVSIQYGYNLGFSVGCLLVDAEDNLYLFGNNSGYNQLYYFKFRPDGTVVKQSAQAAYLGVNRGFFFKGDIVIAGTYRGSGLQSNGGIVVFDQSLNMKSERQYKDLPSHAFSAVTCNDDGSYNIFLHYQQTYSYENFNFVFIQTDKDGSI